MSDSSSMELVTGEDVEVGYVDYFGFAETHQHFLPDEKSFIEHKTFNEGARRRYLNSVNRDVFFGGKGGEARMSMKPGDEKKALIEQAVCGWNLHRHGKIVPFTAKALSDWLNVADPRIVDGLETAIRKANPWMLAEVSIEDLYKERDQLDEMIRTKEKEAEGNVDFVGK